MIKFALQGDGNITGTEAAPIVCTVCWFVLSVLSEVPATKPGACGVTSARRGGRVHWHTCWTECCARMPCVGVCRVGACFRHGLAYDACEAGERIRNSSRKLGIAQDNSPAPRHRGRGPSGGDGSVLAMEVASLFLYQ